MSTAGAGYSPRPKAARLAQIGICGIWLVCMNELRRLAYLHAMGTDAYTSLRQLPGAAYTRRLAMVRKSSPAQTQAVPESVAGSRRAPVQMPELAPASVIPRLESSPPATPARRSVARSPTEEVSPRFSLAAVYCGGWLWLEELERPPVSAAQVQLVQGMATALGLIARGANGGDNASARPEVNQFDWPIHNNRQLDLGRDAARSSAAGFIQRKLEQLECRGLVLLGSGCESRVALDQLECPRVIRTLATGAMLLDPLLKKQAWPELRSQFLRA